MPVNKYSVVKDKEGNVERLDNLATGEFMLFPITLQNGMFLRVDVPEEDMGHYIKMSGVNLRITNEKGEVFHTTHYRNTYNPKAGFILQSLRSFLNKGGVPITEEDLDRLIVLIRRFQKGEGRGMTELRAQIASKEVNAERVHMVINKNFSAFEDIVLIMRTQPELIEKLHEEKKIPVHQYKLLQQLVDIELYQPEPTEVVL